MCTYHVAFACVQVMAERKTALVQETLLGLHYPATDVPQVQTPPARTAGVSGPGRPRSRQ